MSRLSIWACVLICAACLTPLAGAQSASALLCTSYASCSNANYSHHGYQTAQTKSYWNMYTGTNCTNYVAYALIKNNGMSNTRPRSGVGNARDWGVAMSDVTNKTPTVGSVAWWGRASGGNHVAYVERVLSSGEIMVSESNWGRAFDWRRITKGSGWPDGFIHFADAKLANTSKPTVGTAPKIGVTATATPGSWSMSATLSYQWRIDGTAMRGATKKTFTPAVNHLARKLSVTVTAKKSGYPTVSATSAATAVKTGTMASTGKLSASGTPAVDSVLTAKTSGVWSPAPTSYTYQWYADGQKINGATQPTYRPDVDDIGRRIRVNARAYRDGYASSRLDGVDGTAVVPGTLKPAVAPSVTTAPKVDKQLTAKPGTWSRTDVKVAYRWTRNGTTIAGATGPGYLPKPSDVGTKIAVVVTVSRTGFKTVTSTLSSGTVAQATFTKPGTPALTGTPRVGVPLTLIPGTWTPVPSTLRYAWYADGKAIASAKGLSYTPSASMVGKKLTVKVAGERPGYVTRTVATTPTAVASGRAAFTRDPVIVGSPVLGKTLSADPGVKAPPGGKVEYLWYRGSKPLSASSRTYKPKSADLGQKLTVRIKVSAPGYANAFRRSPVVVVKTTPKISVKATGGRGAARFAVTVTATGTSPTGNVSATLVTKKDWHRLNKGKTTLLIQHIAAGKNRAFVIRYGGDAKTLKGERTVRVTVK